jgi:hypothetical protein
MLFILWFILKTIYVDVDGTLLDSRLDNEFASRYGNDSDSAVQWYDNNWCADLEVNWVLVVQLVIMRVIGCKLVLWTNRGSRQVAMTKANLGIVWFLFSDHLFYEGAKRHAQVQGLVIDNERKYEDCGTEFLLIEYWQ